VCKNRSNELTNLSLSKQPTINLPYDGHIHKNAIEMCIHVQGVIKIRKDVLSRKPQRHLKMICTGWNCVFRNSKFTAFQPMIDANEEQMKWSEMVKKLQRKHYARNLTLTELWRKNVQSSQCWKCCPWWCVIHACALCTIRHWCTKPPEFGDYSLFSKYMQW
jgi:hypothetical protein